MPDLILSPVASKTCTKCGESKPATSGFFHRNKNTPSGFVQVCKTCVADKGRASYASDPEKFKARSKLYHDKNTDRHKEYCRMYSAKNSEKLSEKRATRYRDDSDHRDRKLSLGREYHAANREKLNARSKALYEKDKQARFDSNGRNRKERVKTDHVFALKIRVAASIGNHLRKGGYTKKSRSHEVLGCDWGAFKLHIELQFSRGMTWENRSLWHLDHIVPMATAETEGDVIALNHFTNLRPMWAADNIRKSDTVTHLI